VGFGEAARLATQNPAAETARIAALRDRLAAKLQAAISGLVHNNAGAPRIAGNLNLRLPDAVALDLIAAAPSICISTGSACTSAEIAPSHVLTAMGLTRAEASGTLRIGIGRFTSADDIDAAAAAMADAYARIRPHPLHPAKAGFERAEA
jgi:cysteine desulfurase